eukprot:Gb_33169 [translate_table: standard]
MPQPATTKMVKMTLPKCNVRKPRIGVSLHAWFAVSIATFQAAVHICSGRSDFHPFMHRPTEIPMAFADHSYNLSTECLPSPFSNSLVGFSPIWLPQGNFPSGIASVQRRRVVREEMEDQNEQSHGLMHKIHQKAPSCYQILGLITLLTVGGVLLFMTGLTLTGTVIALVVSTPVFVFFSPILVPVGTVLVLAVAGFLTAGGFGVAALSALSWIYNYVKGRHPPGSDQLDYALRCIADTATHMGQRAREYSGNIHTKVQEVTTGA